MIVASTIVPVAIRMPFASRWMLTASSISPPSSCRSSMWRKRRIVVSSGAGAMPRSTPTKSRTAADSYSNSSTPGSDKLNHCCTKYVRSMIESPTGCRPLPAFA